MAEQPKIERYEVITPSDCEIDSYGNMTLTTTTGQKVKINQKHAGLHELLDEASEGGRAVTLGYAVYMEKEYVHTAELFDGEMKDPQSAVEPKKIGMERPKVTQFAPQEIGLWWNNLGNRIGDGSLERDYPNEAVKIKTQYYRQMSKVTGVKFTTGE